RPLDGRKPRGPRDRVGLGRRRRRGVGEQRPAGGARGPPADEGAGNALPRGGRRPAAGRLPARFRRPGGRAQADADLRGRRAQPGAAVRRAGCQGGRARLAVGASRRHTAPDADAGAVADARRARSISSARMKTAVFDIETVSAPWLTLDDQTREKLTRYSEDHEDFLRRKERGALWPYMGRVIVIGMLNPETRRGIVWYEAAEPESSSSDDGLFEYLGSDERTMLREFWEKVEKFDRLVSFNGRGFDAPFLS